MPFFLGLYLFIYYKRIGLLQDFMIKKYMAELRKEYEGKKHVSSYLVLTKAKKCIDKEKEQSVIDKKKIQEDGPLQN